MVEKFEPSEQCLVHYAAISPKEHLMRFRKKSFDKFVQCRTDWLELSEVGRESSSIAKKSLELCTEGEVCFENYYFHEMCYKKFANVSEIAHAQKRKEKLAVTGSTTLCRPQPSKRCGNQPPKAKKVKRPVKKAARPFVIDRETEQEEFVLSEMCIICGKAKKYKRNLITLKYVGEKLARAQTRDAGCLRRAAEKRQHECILRELRGKDCAVIGVRYHTSCYVNYINVLRKRPPPVERKLYEKSYNMFCKVVIEDKILQKRRVFFSTGLFQIFVNIVASVESLDASSYRTERLKRRLLADFPHLVFHKPRRKNRSEIVYSKNVENGEVTEVQPILPAQPETRDTERQ